VQRVVSESAARVENELAQQLEWEQLVGRCTCTEQRAPGHEHLENTRRAEHANPYQTGRGSHTEQLVAGGEKKSA